MPTRLAVFSLVDWSFAVVRDWAASAGHDIALLVTRPSRGTAPGLQDMSQASPETVVIVAPNVRACETTLSELEVDLAVVFTFLRVPESIANIPRHGCVNLHPSLLPAYRGANALRSLYEGEPRIGATLHYLTPEFDAGAILAQSSLATPQDVEPLQRAGGAATSLEGLPRCWGPPSARRRTRGRTGCFGGQRRSQVQRGRNDPVVRGVHPPLSMPVQCIDFVWNPAHGHGRWRASICARRQKAERPLRRVAGGGQLYITAGDRGGG